MGQAGETNDFKLQAAKGSKGRSGVTGLPQLGGLKGQENIMDNQMTDLD